MMLTHDELTGTKKLDGMCSLFACIILSRVLHQLPKKNEEENFLQDEALYKSLVFFMKHLLSR